MQPCIFLYTVRLYEFDKSREGNLGMHHVEDGIVVAIPAIVEQKCCYDVECRIVILLSSNQCCPLLETAWCHTPSRQYISCRRTYSLFGV